MLKLERYVASEVLPNILAGLLVFTALFLFDKMFSIANLVIIKGLGAFFVIQILGLSVPAIVSMTFPMASLLGNMLAFSRLAEDNEITAMLSSGQSYLRIFSGSLILSAFFSFFFVLYNFNITPRIEQRFNALYGEIMKKNPGIILKEHIVHEIKDSKIYIGSIDYALSRLTRVRLFKLKKGHPPSCITAKTGSYSLDSAEMLRLQLNNGSIYYGDAARPEIFSVVDFSRFNILYNLSTGKISTKTEEKPFSGMTRAELREMLRRYSAYPEMKTRLLIQYNLRISAAFAIFFLTLLAMPLGMEIRRKAKAVSFGLSLLSIFAYYILLMFSISLAEKGSLDPFLAVWTPNIVFFCISLAFILRKKMI